MGPTFYSATGEITTCDDLIARRGGWDQITAVEASQLTSLGCYPGLLESDQVNTEYVPYWAAPDAYEEVAAAPMQAPPITAPSPSPPSIPQEEPVFESEFPLGISGGEISFASVFNPIVSAAVGAFAEQFPGPVVPVSPGGVRGQTSDMPTFQDVVGGMSTTGGLACWKPTKTGKLGRRAQVRLRRMPDGSITVEKYCRPKRMNPLNPRALGRAARRLGSFQRIAAATEKLIARSCKVRSRSRRPSFGGSCAPRRCK